MRIIFQKNGPTLVNILPRPINPPTVWANKTEKRTPIDFHAGAPPPPCVQSYSRGTRSRDRTGGHEALGTTLKAYKRERRRRGGLTYQERLQSSRVYRGGWRVLRLIPTAPADRIPIPPIPVRVSSLVERRERSVALCARTRCAFIKRGEEKASQERERSKEERIRIR